MAIKFLRQYAHAAGEPHRFRVISCMPSYHGATLGVLALNGDVELEPVYGPMVTLSSKIPAPLTYRAPSAETAARVSAVALESEILRLGAETVLAFIVEPVGGQASGANVPDPLFFREIRRICSKYGVYLIFDEVMSSMRTGAFLAAHFVADARPDLVVIAKGLGAGYAPLGAVLAPARLVDGLASTTGFNLQHTYNANPISCAAGCAVLDEVLERDLMDRARTLGERLKIRLQGLIDASPLVGDVRGKGLLLAIELVADQREAVPFPATVNVPERLRLAAAGRGLLLYSRRQNNGMFGDWTLIAPALIATEAECDEIVERLHSALVDVQHGLRSEGVL
jgi:adenosylmethionine-8-amino-7-oxononanoate aminotransferase